MTLAAADIAANLAAVRARIAAAAKGAGRDPDAIALVAVGKGHDAQAMRAALAAGQRVFGENRVQEAVAKWPALREEFPDVVLRMIGPLQTNKAADAVRLFDVIETVDRTRLASKLRAEIDRLGDAARTRDVLVQVNTGEEPQKAGVTPAAADTFIAAVRDTYRLPVSGLMCVPPVDEEPALHFALLARIAERNGLARLSMGMSGDFETAVAFGATAVRVGSAIFGPR